MLFRCRSAAARVQPSRRGEGTVRVAWRSVEGRGRRPSGIGESQSPSIRGESEEGSEELRFSRRSVQQTFVQGGAGG